MSILILVLLQTYSCRGQLQYLIFTFFQFENYSLLLLSAEISSTHGRNLFSQFFLCWHLDPNSCTFLDSWFRELSACTSLGCEHLVCRFRQAHIPSTCFWMPVSCRALTFASCSFWKANTQSN